MTDLTYFSLSALTSIDAAPDSAISYDCQWSGEWSPVPGCAIEVDVNYEGDNLNGGDVRARGSDRQPDAHACQAFCRASNTRGAIQYTLKTSYKS